MEPNDSRSLDWKTCFKKILAPHLLNPSEVQNDASLPLNRTNTKEQNDVSQNIANLKNDGVGTTAFLSDPEKLENVHKNINSSITVESARIDSSPSLIDGCQDSESPDSYLNDDANPMKMEENVANIIAADAEELAKSFTALKVERKKKKCHNLAQNSRNAPDWNIAFKKAINPKSVRESSLKTSEEFVDEKPFLSHPDLPGSQERNPWLYHRLCKKDEHLENIEVAAQSSSENCNEERHYTEEEKKVLETFKQARTFKLRPKPPKPHMNIFDGAGVNCFKDSEIKSSTKNRSSNSDKPKNVPPPGGWVCIKPLTIEEVRKKPPNIIATECWDWDEDDW